MESNSSSLGNVAERAPYSLEITGKTINQLVDAKHVVPAKTPVNIAFLGTETHEQRLHVARTIRELGFEAVPIISSRRLTSVEELDWLLENYQKEAAPQRFIFVGGDPATPAGPFDSAIKVLDSGVLERHGITNVGIVGHPEGNTYIDDATAADSLRAKLEILEKRGCDVEITTQYGLDAQAMVDWVVQLREQGITAPLRLGIPGPVSTKTLLRFADMFGTQIPEDVAQNYGIDANDPQKTVTADSYINTIFDAVAAQNLGPALLHMYPFGGVSKAVQWIEEWLSATRLA